MSNSLIHDLLGRALKPVYLWGPAGGAGAAAIRLLDGLTGKAALGFLVVQGANVRPWAVKAKVLLVREAREAAPAGRCSVSFYPGAPVIAPARPGGRWATSISRQPCNGASLLAGGRGIRWLLPRNKGATGQQRRAGHHEQRLDPRGSAGQSGALGKGYRTCLGGSVWAPADAFLWVCQRQQVSER